MSDWTGGYIADIGYTYGYYGELNPHRIKLAFLRAGLACPDNINACELGFGQGVSSNLHAAASVTNWYGTDFNPAQAGYAQQLAEASGANARLFDESFAEFCSRPDLPQFDFIGMHGIWSWISDENRQIITDFLRRKLKVGGVLYVSYNTQPGWAAMAPMRDLLVEHAELMGAAGHGIVPRIDSALEFASKLVGAGARYGVANPGVAARLEALKGQNRNYLAHEYFNRDWEPMSFSKMTRWLGDAKLDFACSAHLLDHVDAINMPVEQQQILKDIPDRSFRETVRDFLVNQQFRRDYWVRGLRPVSALERVEKLRAQRFIMVAVREEITLKVSGAIGEAVLHENVYVPLLDLLSDLRVHTLHDIERALEGKADFNGVLQALMILAGKGCIQLVQDDMTIKAATPQANRLNRELCNQARYSEAVSALASPVTGGGVGLNRFEQLFLLSSKDAPNEPAAWARSMLQALAAQGQRMLVEGKLAESPEIEREAALRLANDFKNKRLPVLKALRVQC